jgi:hypothetical protein
MFKNPFEKFADKLLGQDKRGQELKKYNIDLSGVLGEGVDQEELQHNENRKLVGLTKTCLMNQLHFWMRKPGDHSSRIAYIERDIKQAATICDHINKKTYSNKDITLLKSILSKHGCI